MPLTLPARPAPRLMTPRLVSSRNELVPAFGGPTMRNPRMGSRYALDYELPPQTALSAQDWADIDDETDTCVIAIYQPGLDTGAPGAPLVDGASQTGSVLALKGLTPNYIIQKNQWLSVITGGQRFAYRAKDYVVVANDGTVDVPLRTMLRKAHANNDMVEIARPMIEGYVSVPVDAWTVEVDRLVRLSFTITERE